VLLSLSHATSVRAQSTYIHVLQNPIRGFAGETDTNFRILISYGTTDSVFHPDPRKLHYRVESVTPPFTLRSPEVGDFTGIDTLLVSYPATLTGGATGTVGIMVMYKATQEVTLNLERMVYNPLQLVQTWYGYPAVELGRERCLNYYILRNPNDFPIVVSSIAFSKTDFLQLDSVRLPLTIASHTELPIRVCVKAPRSVDTIEGDIRIIAGYNERHLDTLQAYTIIPIRPLSFDDCIATDWVFLDGPLYPWSATVDTMLFLTNNLATPVIVNAIEADTTTDARYFQSIQHPLPFTIGPHATDSVHATGRLPVGPAANSFDAKWTVRIAGEDSLGLPCPNNYFRITGDVKSEFHTIPRTAVLTGGEEVYFRSFGNVIDRMIEYHSSSLTPDTIESVTISGPNAGAFALWHYQPASVLSLSDSFGVYVAFPSSYGFPYGEYFATLELHSIHGETYTTPLRGTIQSMSTKGSGNISNVSVGLHPNPASAEFTLTVEHAKSWDILISDVLGKTVYDGHAQRGTTLSSSTLPRSLTPGSYIVRLSGIDESGRQFVQARQLVIVH
jgi:hypothetical protein